MSTENEDWGCRICEQESVGYFLGKKIVCYQCYEEYASIFGIPSLDEYIPREDNLNIEPPKSKPKKRKVPKHPLT